MIKKILASEGNLGEPYPFLKVFPVLKIPLFRPCRVFDILGVVKARYLDSKFLNRPNSVNLLAKLMEAISPLGLVKLLQLSMDGPTVNVDVLKKLRDIRSEKGHSDMMNIGSCGLHVIHGAFKTGMTSQEGWKLKELFNAMFYLFNDSPARREMYIRVTGSEVFALSYA